MNNIIVIHHSADFDGLFCREIARKFFADRATYVGWDYGDPIPFVPEDAKLYMLDISIAELMAHPNLTWIDHHKTAMAKFPETIRGYRIDGVAACRLAWQWFFRDTPGDIAGGPLSTKEDFVERAVVEPYAVRLAGEYDIWDKRDPNAELFQHGLRSCNLADKWSLLLQQPRIVPIADVERMVDSGFPFDISPDGRIDESKPPAMGLLHAGRSIAYVREQEYAQVIAEQGFTIQFEGLTLLACCSHECDIRSHLFAAGIRPEYEGLLGFTYTGKDWRVSLYGVPGKPDIDLSSIALKFGGGGHKQACGFRAPKLPFLP